MLYQLSYSRGGWRGQKYDAAANRARRGPANPAALGGV